MTEVSRVEHVTFKSNEKETKVNVYPKKQNVYLMHRSI